MDVKCPGSKDNIGHYKQVGESEVRTQSIAIQTVEGRGGHRDKGALDYKEGQRWERIREYTRAFEKDTKSSRIFATALESKPLFVLWDRHEK